MDEFIKLLRWGILLQLRVINRRMVKDGWLLITSERGAVYRTKRIGPRTDPCGTSQQMGTGAELQFLTVTV